MLSSNSGPDTAYLIVNLKQARAADQHQRLTSRGCVRNLAKSIPLEQFLFVSGGIVNMALERRCSDADQRSGFGRHAGQCRDAAERVVEVVQAIPGTEDVQIAQSLDYPQFDVQVDRTRAKYLGLDQEEVAQTILTALGSSVGYAPTIWIDPKSGVDFFMGVQYETNEFESLDEVRNIPLSLSTADGPITIPLSNIATVKRVTIPGEIAHYNIARVNDVHVNVSGRDVGSVARTYERRSREMEFESGVSATFAGPSKRCKRA